MLWKTERSSSLQMTPPWGHQLVCSWAGLPSRGTQTGWRNGPTGPLQNSARAKAKSCTCKETTPCNGTAWGLPGWSSSVEEAVGCWWAAPRQQRGPPASWAALAGAWLVCQGKGLPSSMQHLLDHIQNTAGLWALQYNRDTSPGESDQAGRDRMTHPLSRGCMARACSVWRRLGFGRT